ncbi:medium chain dehydrogenase/reductase family protein [Streptomonospora sp. S1-112]|uniref:Medium chain dehydrogenase/reductase family protein n=1 Tax=Streptomonospora mangrovi TaxID=2883123 RepID=A0A9X3NKX3_9ACTN|nr:medium chain dehydrogenase/reductase family protein [Streptomonospora mangrovi]MDA0563988.1 medium chain dehydrogenase/reductase family protein [Streptomonospora mangrovi]
MDRTEHTPAAETAANPRPAPRDRTSEAVEVVLPGIVEPAGLQVRRRDLPPPAAGEAVVEVEATGVSFAEQQMRRGKYYDQPPFPFVPGYDLVGTVARVGPGVDPAMVGRRYAAMTKTGGWASRVVLPAADLVPVPDGVDPAEAETLVVSGITAWRMLHGLARVRAGQTVLVHGANGGVGTTLVQLARHAGARVIGTAAPRHHDAVRALGAEPVDYRDPDLPARVRALAPEGIDAVFDHVGGPGIVDSFRLLNRGGTLVSYGTAATRDVAGSSRLPVLALLLRLAVWNALPNGRRAHFFNVWSGSRDRDRFRARLRDDLGAVFALLAEGTLTARVAARLPLAEAAAAVELAESKTVVGKVVLLGAES